MTNQHPITPPPELVQQWRKSGPADVAVNNAYECHIASLAAQWGADQELEACCEWLKKNTDYHMTIEFLRAARRPKPPTLKEQALAVLEEEPEDAKELIVFDVDQVKIIRRALEALND
jgi:DNA replication protein DnaC